MALTGFELSRSFSLEATGKTGGDVVANASRLPAGASVNVVWLNGDQITDRVNVALQLHQNDLSPVPILAARRVTSEGHLDVLMNQMLAAVQPTQVMVVGGDPGETMGPFATAFDLLNSHWLERAGINRVTLPGFPDGKPVAPQHDSVGDLRDKVTALRRRGISAEITSQLALNSTRILSWIKELRGGGVDSLIRIGVTGPTPVASVRRYLEMFGVSDKELAASSEEHDGIMEFSPLLAELQEGLSATEHGQIALHLYPFGGTRPAVDWITSRDAVGVSA